MGGLVKGFLYGGARSGWPDLCVTFGVLFVLAGATHGESVGSGWGLGGETVWRRVQITRTSGVNQVPIDTKLGWG